MLRPPQQPLDDAGFAAGDLARRLKARSRKRARRRTRHALLTQATFVLALLLALAAVSWPPAPRAATADAAIERSVPAAPAAVTAPAAESEARTAS